jgi:pyruvate ferredoxin oxidoreductase gamma subunit
MYRIRFHGRGGQGIKTASRVLGSAFFHAGFEVQDAPVYGAERRGAPVVAYVRAGRSPIRERGSIGNPDLVVVVDAGLIPVPAAGVLLGVTARTVMLIHSPIAADEWRRRLNAAGAIVTVPPRAQDGTGSGSPYASMACAGAAARLVGCVTRNALVNGIHEELRGASEAVVSANVEQALAAYDARGTWTGLVSEGGEISAADYVRPEWVNVSAEPADISAPDIRASATSTNLRTGSWRTMRPVIDLAQCHGCTWICSTLCPDSAIRVTPEGRPEIDEEHCKGCLVCVAVCPHHAIAVVPEISPTRSAP